MKDLYEITDLPQEIRNFAEARKIGGEAVPATLENILPGVEWAAVRTALKETGLSVFRDRDGNERILVADFDADGNVMAIASAIPRNPGKSVDFVKQIEDFRELVTSTKAGRKEFIALAHRVYRMEGPINNAISKLAALVAPAGSFKVRGVRGKQGQSGSKRAQTLQDALNWWKDNVNARGNEFAITGDRGIRSFIRRGTRLALIEGDHFARHVWPEKPVNIPNVGKFYLPMNLQTFSAQHIEVLEGFEGTDFEVYYWVPPRKFIQTLRNPRDPEAAKLLDKLLSPNVREALLKNGKVLLDPALLVHVKNKGTGVEAYGESVIEPTLPAVRYQRALDALEITTITNLINRLVIVKVGSDNEKSVYHRQEVTGARLSLLQRLMQNVGPSAMVLWGGPDISIEQVGAHDSILNLGDRYKIAERRLLMSLGLPAVLMIGEGTDGKAAGWAATLGVVAQLQEIQDQYAQVLKSIAERVAMENGYEDVDVMWEWHDNLLDNSEAAAELVLKLFQLGLLSTQTALEKLDIDYGAEEIRQAEDVRKGYKREAFGPPLASFNNPTGRGGEDGGRPTKEERPESDPREGQETKSPEENK